MHHFLTRRLRMTDDSQNTSILFSTDSFFETALGNFESVQVSFGEGRDLLALGAAVRAPARSGCGFRADIFIIFILLLPPSKNVCSERPLFTFG